MSQRNLRNFLLLYRILLRVQKGMYPSQIARQLHISKQLCLYYIHKAEKLGYLEIKGKTNFLLLELTKEGKEFLARVKKSSLPLRKQYTRLHNLAIKFPILKDNPKAKWQKTAQINNWIKHYSVVTFPIGITLEKTTKHIIAYFHQFTTEKQMFLDEFYSWVLRGVYYVYYYLKKQKKITIDIFRSEIIRQHVANESPEFNPKVSKRKTVEVNLKRKAKSILPTNLQAKAWIDRSLGNVDIETNDMLYEEKLLLMPEMIYSLAKTFLPAIEQLAYQINLHLEVQNQQLLAIKELRKEISKISKILKELKK